MSGRVTVVGLGPAGPELVNRATADALASIEPRFLRTDRHPAAGVATWTATFDEVYQSAPTLEAVYAGIVDALAEAAADEGHVLYAVPGSPAVAERSVELLLADGRVDVAVVPALSFLDLAWGRLAADPVARGVRVVDGHRFGVEAAGERGPLLVAQCDSRAVLSDVKLALPDDAAADAGATVTVTVLHHLGLPDERVFDLPVAELDRSFEPDHLTSLWLPVLAAPVAAEVVRFAELVRTLRERCPWDREQTHQSLTRHLLEETYEVLEAIDELPAPASYAHLEEELGDLLFQVVFHSVLATESGQFDLAGVARGIHDKLVRRHPHVFGDVAADTADAVVTNWEQIKKAEKGRTSVFDGIPGNLPSLLYAHKVLRKAASLGLDDPAPPGSPELGDRLLALVDEAGRTGADAEAALRAATARLRDRATALERD
jgi:tetrapyrrole methylase family protein / MazG family protein